MFFIFYRLVMNDYLPQISFQVAGPSRDVVALRHQFPYQHRCVYKEVYLKVFFLSINVVVVFREVVVGEGPRVNPNFRNRVWTFNVRGVDMRLTMHQNDGAGVRRAVTSELERLIFSALEQCERDGASPNDFVHLYLECSGLEYRFSFNPCGPHAVTLGKVFMVFLCINKEY